MIEQVVEASSTNPGILASILALGIFYLFRYVLENREPRFDAPKLYEEKGNKDLVKLHSVVKTEFQKVCKIVLITLIRRRRLNTYP